MTQAQRDALKEQLRGPGGQRGIPFNQPGSLTKVYAVASGKGGVGKSSVTVNLACALAAQGLRVGIVDADVYGFSVPALMGITQAPTRVDDMILPPVAYGVKVISIGMFVTGNQPVAWRGPMLHRALEQFLTDVYFGDLERCSWTCRRAPATSPSRWRSCFPRPRSWWSPPRRRAAADVAERAGAIATQTGQTVAGVIENMSYPGNARRRPDGPVRQRRRGGARRTAQRFDGHATCRCWGRFRWTSSCAKAATRACPSSWVGPETPAAAALSGIAGKLAAKPRGLAGMRLDVQPR